MAKGEGALRRSLTISGLQRCRLANVDPIDHIADVLARVATHSASSVAELLPANWARKFAPEPTLV